MSSKIALSYGKNGRTRLEDVGMIRTSRCRVRWREGAHHPDDKWVVVSLYFYDENQKLIVPKKAISSGGRGSPNSHDLAIYIPKDSQALYHFPHEWDGRRAGTDLFLGGIFNNNTRIASIRIIHNHDPVGAMGDPKTLAVEYWDSMRWVEYADDKWKPDLKYSNGISSYQEKRERERSSYLQVNLEANAFLRDTIEPNESQVEYLMNTELLAPTDKWRVSCVDTSDWTWDVKKLKFIDDDGSVIFPLRGIKSGNYNSYYSANAAVLDQPFDLCWGGKMDPDSRTFYIGGQFRAPVLLGGIEVVQPYGEHRRNALYVEYWDMDKEVWYKIARYDFFDSFIRRGPVYLCILSSEPIVLSTGKDRYRIGDDPELDDMMLSINDFRKEVNDHFPDEESNINDGATPNSGVSKLLDTA